MLLYPVYDTRRRPQSRRTPGNVILVATDSAAPSTAFLRERWRDDPGRRPDGARSRSRDRGPLGAAGSLRRRARADGRLRADGRAPDRVSRVVRGRSQRRRRRSTRVTSSATVEHCRVSVRDRDAAAPPTAIIAASVRWSPNAITSAAVEPRSAASAGQRDLLADTRVRRARRTRRRRASPTRPCRRARLRRPGRARDRRRAAAREASSSEASTRAASHGGYEPSGRGHQFGSRLRLVGRLAAEAELVLPAEHDPRAGARGARGRGGVPFAAASGVCATIRVARRGRRRSPRWRRSPGRRCRRPAPSPTALRGERAVATTTSMPASRALPRSPRAIGRRRCCRTAAACRRGRSRRAWKRAIAAAIRRTCGRRRAAPDRRRAPLRTPPRAGRRRPALAAERRHLAEAARRARSTAATPKRVASTRSNAVGVPPRCRCPSTVTRVSKPVSRSSSAPNA